MKYIIINKKGGCGKSVTAMQIIAPYMYECTKQPSDYIELDFDNYDHGSFTKTKLVSCLKPMDCFSNFEQFDLYFSYIEESKNAIIDVGAGDSAMLTLKKLQEHHLMNDIDLFIIPMGADEMDTVDALETIKQLTEIKPDVRFMVALSKYNSHEYEPEEQFIMFFGDSKNATDSPFIKEHNYAQELEQYPGYRGYFLVRDLRCISVSRFFNMTAYEMADLKASDFSEEVQNRRRALLMQCRSFKNNDLPYIFERIDKAVR